MSTNKVINMLAEYLDIDTSGFSPGTNLVTEYSFDYFDCVNLKDQLEETFNIFINEEEMLNLQTVDDIVTLVEYKK